MVNPSAAARRHNGCIPHKRYQLRCVQCDELLARSGNRCEICQAAASRQHWGKLCIDHDHAVGLWAVRGLLCHNCNRELDRSPVKSADAKAYLRNAWYLSQGWPLGLPTEPPDGYRARIPHNKVWIRNDGLWERLCPRPNLLDLHTVRTWAELVHLAGSHNIILLDPGDTSIRWQPLLATRYAPKGAGV